MVLDPLLQALIVSASLGSLVGLERQWRTQQGHHEHDKDSKLMGVRTFTLWALFGTLSAYISEAFIAAFYPISFTAMAALLILHFVFDPEHRGFGFTTITVALLTFSVGSLVYWDQTRVAVIFTICMILLLSSKKPINRWIQRFTPQDLRSALQFAAITGVILPVVPNQAFGLFDAFNPFSTWLMVVLVAGIGFLGYVAMRALGTRSGIGVTGIIGGLVSSTATALAFGRQSKLQPELSKSFALAIVMASVVMLGRILVLISIVHTPIVSVLWPVMLLMAIPGILIALMWWRHSQSSSQHDETLEKEIINPLSLKMAIKFALLYSVIVFLAKAGAWFYGDAGVYAVSFLSGMTNLSAIALSLSQMTISQQITPVVAAQSVTLAVFAALMTKIALALIVGSKQIRPFLITVFGATIALGVVGWLLI